jgi:hypothetical protein
VAEEPASDEPAGDEPAGGASWRPAGSAMRVAVDQAWSGVGGAGRAGRAGFGRGLLLIAETARIRLATPEAKSPALPASRAAACGLGSRIPAITLQSGHTQHSGLPVAQAPPP